MFKKTVFSKTTAILFSCYCVCVCAGPGCPNNNTIPNYTFVPASVDIPNGQAKVAGQITNSLLFVVPVMINDKGPYRFIVDTGAGSCFVSTRIGNQLPGTNIAVLSIGTGGVAQPQPTVQIETLKIGSMTFGNFLAVKQDLIAFQSLGVDGMIGIPTFHDVTMGIDYPSRQLLVQTNPLDQHECNLPIDGGNSTPEGGYDVTYVNIDVAGRKIRAVVDSGSSGFLGIPQSMRNLPLTGPLKNQQFDGVNGTETTQVGNLNGNITIGCNTFEQPSISFHAMDGSTVGAKQWQDKTLWIDQRSKMMRLAPSQGCPPNHDCVNPDTGCPTIAGTWDTTYGTMTFSDGGSGTNMAYGYTDTITVDSLVAGDGDCATCLVLDGTWLRTDGPDGFTPKGGKIHFVFDAANRSFLGQWSQDPDTGWKVDQWSGYRDNCN